MIQREGSRTFRQGTIAAIATSLGEGAIGIVRISGPEALPIADRILSLAGGRALSSLPAGTVCYGKAMADGGEEIDEVITFAFRAPKSYTREDLVEIQAHGGTVVLKRLLQAVLAAGAVLAEPGEFTARAVLNGRLSLAQAEAIPDLVRAKTDAAAAAALRRLSGEGGSQLLSVEDETLAILAEVEAWLDFPEDVPLPALASIRARAEETLAKLDRIIAGAHRGRLLSEGATVVIMGRPNVGKSSLLNAILGEERAIVADLPGTTRDAVAEEIDLAGMPVRLVDTAGMGKAADQIEAMGIARSRKEIAAADLVLLVLDRSEPMSVQDEIAAAEASAHGPGLVALNKADLPSRLAGLPGAVKSWPAIDVSARTGAGLPALTAAITAGLGGQNEGTPLLSHLRQIEAAQEARGCLQAFHNGLLADLPWDILAEDLRASLSAISRLTGKAVGQDLMEEVFSRFCVGK